MDRGDLHIHTDVSDGAFSPAQVARCVLQGGLGFVSVTDHNSLGALGTVEAALRGSGVEFISGVELSVQPQRGGEIHILGYGCDPSAAALKDICQQLTDNKKEQLREIVRLLKQQGVVVDLAALDLEGQGYVGRPVLADLLVRKGFVSSVNQAFGRYLNQKAPTFVPMRSLAPKRCIGILHECGGVAVLAHPTIEIVDRWIDSLAREGLDGVEVYRPALNGNEQLYIEKAAEHFSLFVTGGSDWHGRDSEPALGTFAVQREQVAGFFASLSPAGDGPAGRR